jgi:hypothetical protein
MTPAERAQLKKRLESHLRCAERFPGKRAQHLNAATECARLLGFDLYGPPPALSPGLQNFAEKIRRSYATARVSQARRSTACTICGENLGPGDLYLGLARYKLCKVCARKHGGHVGAWRRGEWFQVLR